MRAHDGACVPGADGPVAPDATGSTSTSQPFDVGIPVPAVLWPISRQVGGPYGTKIMPTGTFPSRHWKVASPFSDRTRTVPPEGIPASFMSSACMVMVPTMVWYTGLSLPTLICWPCLVVRPTFMMKRLPAIHPPRVPGIDRNLPERLVKLHRRVV